MLHVREGHIRPAGAVQGAAPRDARRPGAGQAQFAPDLLSSDHAHTTRDFKKDVDLQQHGDPGQDDLVDWLPLTLFERTQIIVVRAEQISKGAEALIAVPKNITAALDIADLEVSSGALDHWTIDRRGTKVRVGSIRNEVIIRYE